MQAALLIICPVFGPLELGFPTISLSLNLITCTSLGQITKGLLIQVIQMHQPCFNGKVGLPAFDPPLQPALFPLHL